MKILYVTTVGMTMNFFKALVGELIKEGHAVDIACNEDEYKVDDFFRKSILGSGAVIRMRMNAVAIT